MDIVLVGVSAALAFVIYILKRHAGTLLLALMSGALLASLAAKACATWLQAHGFEFQNAPLEPVAGVGLMLTPVIIGWFAGPKSRGRFRRLLGAVVIMVTAAALLAPLAGMIFHQDLVAKAQLDDLLISYQGFIVAGATVYALLDLYLSKVSTGKEEKAKK